MRPSHLMEGRQHNGTTLSHKVGGHEDKLLSTRVSVPRRQVYLSKDPDGRHAVNVQRILTHCAPNRPIACKYNMVGFAQPIRLGLLDPFQIVVAELLAAMINI